MSSVDWVPELSAALDRLVPLEDGSLADWDDVVGRVDRHHELRLWEWRPRRNLRLALVVAVLFLLLTGVATATYLLLRDNGGIALGGGGLGSLPVVNPNGPGLHAVANCTGQSPGCTISEQAWSPDGTRLAFIRGRSGGRSGKSRMFLYVAAASGGGARRLAACGGCADLLGARLSWSPDGRWIAFSRDNGPKGQVSLWEVAAAGGRLRRLTECQGWCADIIPTWAPDGKLLVFQRIARAGSGDPNSLYTVRPDGSGLTKIASGADPHWSPDGTRIAFDGADGVEVANADGSDAQVLAAGTGGSVGAPSWSPDGSKLVYFVTPRVAAGFRAEVWTMNTDGSGKQRLYSSGCCLGGFASPIWSPDGRMIAFSANSAGGTFVMNADGTGLRRLSRDTAYYLSWQGVPQH